MIKLSAVQLSSSADVTTNLATIEQILTDITGVDANDNNVLATQEKVEHLVVLPECCLLFGSKDSAQLTLAQETAEHNNLCQSLAKLAQRFKVYLVAGTIPLISSTPDKFTNSCCVFNPSGDMIGQYDKIHLFDVSVSDNTKSYSESRYTQAGSEVKVVNSPFANIGLSVCFDLRFPRLFQQLREQGADIITVPSAFTRVTGKAHWQTLLQARAIENQVYIIAAGQEGVHENGRETWGHSMIINPWGEVEQCKVSGVGYISVDYHEEELTRIRQSMPLRSPLN